ncbi:MAG: YciI family protein [Rubrivivax sp.]
MPYMLLIVEPPEQRAERGEAAGREVYQQMLDWSATLQQRGVLMQSSSLAHSREAVRLQVREGRRHVVDGPFTEAKEMVGGFFLLDVATRDEAVAIAAQCPAAQWCTVEVRATGPCYQSG